VAVTLYKSKHELGKANPESQPKGLKRNHIQQRLNWQPAYLSHIFKDWETGSYD
jgi:hypothetical protein